jgi:hypothetical protein
MPATFMITLTSTAPEIEAIRGLRFLLKRALRTHGLKCIDAQQISSASGESPQGRAGRHHRQSRQLRKE